MDEEKCLKRNKLCDKGRKLKGFSGVILISDFPKIFARNILNFGIFTFLLFFFCKITTKYQYYLSKL